LKLQDPLFAADGITRQGVGQTNTGEIPEADSACRGPVIRRLTMGASTTVQPSRRFRAALSFPENSGAAWSGSRTQWRRGSIPTSSSFSCSGRADPDQPRLWGIQGYRYDELLLDVGHCGEVQSRAAESRPLLARDLEEVYRIATRSGMRLYLADYHLAMGHRTGDQNTPTKLRG
jgi:hypothetical protein